MSKNEKPSRLFEYRKRFKSIAKQLRRVAENPNCLKGALWDHSYTFGVAVSSMKVNCVIDDAVYVILCAFDDDQLNSVPYLDLLVAWLRNDGPSLFQHRDSYTPCYYNFAFDLLCIMQQQHPAMMPAEPGVWLKAIFPDGTSSNNPQITDVNKLTEQSEMFKQYESDQLMQLANMVDELVNYLPIEKPEHSSNLIPFCDTPQNELNLIQNTARVTTPKSHTTHPLKPDNSESGQNWITISMAAKISAINRGTISRATDNGDITSNGFKGPKRRLNAGSFANWAATKDGSGSDETESDESVERLLNKHK